MDTNSRPITFLTGFSDIRSTYSGSKISLPEQWQEKIDIYWEEQLALGRPLRRGEVFSILTISENEDKSLHIKLGLTDYAHYLFSQDKTLPEEIACRVSHTSVVVETSDGYLVFGKMGEQTASPGRIQCAGGGITFQDIRDGVVDYEKNAREEFFEEMGISSEDEKKVATFVPLCLAQGGAKNSVAVVFFARLKLTRTEMDAHFLNFSKEKGKEPSEFQNLVYVEKTSAGKDNFLSEVIYPGKERVIEYLVPLLNFLLEHDASHSKN